VMRSTARVGQEEPAEACCTATEKSGRGPVRRRDCPPPHEGFYGFFGIISDLPIFKPTIAHPIDVRLGDRRHAGVQR
jgi:hypothetical protein